jgi:hypothetical protein
LVTATIFDEANPPLSNDNTLKSKDDNLYVASDGSTWTYNTVESNYKTYAVAASTPFNLANTETNAGNNTTGSIWRAGNIGIGINNPATNLHIQNPLRATATSNANAQVLRLSRPTTTNAKWDNIAQFNLGSYSTAIAANSRLDLALTNGGNAVDFTNVMTWQANGNVGINNIAPSAPLVVQGVTGTGALKLIAPSVAANDNWWMGFGHGTTSTDANDRARIGVDIFPGGPGRLFFTTGSPNAQTRAMFIDENQRVGIGTSAPLTTLHVNNSLAATNTVNANAQVFRMMRPRADAVKSENIAQFNLGSYAVTSGNTHATSRLDLAMNDGDGPNTSNVMTWQANGNVGIRNTAPTATLDVNSSRIATNTINADATVLKLARPLNDGLKFPNIALFNLGSHTIGGQANTRLDLSLSNVNDTDIQNVMTWQANGNVGIGTTAPTSRLEVNGAATNTTSFNAGAGTTIDFSRSNLAYTTASPGAFTLSNLKDGGTYTLAVQGKAVGTASFTASGFTFKSPNNGPTTNLRETIYTFIVMGTSVYVYMTAGIANL